MLFAIASRSIDDKSVILLLLLLLFHPSIRARYMSLQFRRASKKLMNPWGLVGYVSMGGREVETAGGFIRNRTFYRPVKSRQ